MTTDDAVFQLAEGGAYGHLMHLYDNRSLTFSELKDVLASAAVGRLEAATEKTDGMNLVFTWDSNADQLKVARSAGDIKKGGMDAAALSARFAGRPGNVVEAFDTAFKVVEDAARALPDNVRHEVFGDSGDVWYSAEVIYSSSPNVINYDKNYIVFHAHGSFALEGGRVVRRSDAPSVGLLERYIDTMQRAVTQRSWQLAAPQVARLQRLDDGTALQAALSAIGTAQSHAGVDDSATVGDYMKALATDEVASLGLPERARDAVVARIVGAPGAPTLNQIKKVVDPAAYAKVNEFVKGSDATMARLIAPIEMAVHRFSVELLRGMRSVMVNDHDAEVMRIRAELTKAIQAIQAAGDARAMQVLGAQLAKLGAMEDVAASAEGVVFQYKGNAYKFTGSFAPVNQIMGMLRFGRGGPKANEGSVRRMRTSMGTLREFICRLLETGTGSRLDAEEASAKTRYDSAKDRLAQWDIEAAKKTAFLAKAKELGLSPEGEAARKKLKSLPQYGYDAKVLHAQRKTLEDDVEKARAAYASYAPLEAGPITRPAGPEEKERTTAPDPNTPSYAKVSDIRPNQLYEWSDPRWNKALSSLGSVFSKKRSDDDKAGTGPGETHLATIFGAAVQGGGTSYDLVTDDGRKWEVKALESPSDTIRPGTEGRRAFVQTKRHLDNVMKQMKSFVDAVNKFDIVKDLEEHELEALSYVVDFIDNDFEEIVSKGEITFPRRKALRATLKAIKTIKASWTAQGIDDTIDTTVGLAGHNVRVDRPTYIDVAQRVKKATDVNVLQGLRGKELALVVLKDRAFDDPSTFLDEWYESVDVNVVFEQVDGVFIVTPEGFFLVPRSSFKNAFKFVKVSQGQPRFIYAYFSDEQA